MPLKHLAIEISQCTQCDSLGFEVIHCPPMIRGESSQIIIIGEDPGRTEVESGKAFSGASGKRLMKWLIEAKLGNSREELFQNIYFTSLCK